MWQLGSQTSRKFLAHKCWFTALTSEVQCTITCNFTYQYPNFLLPVLHVLYQYPSNYMLHQMYLNNAKSYCSNANVKVRLTVIYNKPTLVPVQKIFLTFTKSSQSSSTVSIYKSLFLYIKDKCHGTSFQKICQLGPSCNVQLLSVKKYPITIIDSRIKLISLHVQHFTAWCINFKLPRWESHSWIYLLCNLLAYMYLFYNSLAYLLYCMKTRFQISTTCGLLAFTRWGTRFPEWWWS